MTKEFPTLKNPLILAPMAEVSSLPFRLLCRKYGAAMAYTEQLSALAITRDSEKTFHLARTSKEDNPSGIQLFGRNPDLLIQAAKVFEKDFDLVDINMGCPSKKIVSQGYGSALLKEKDRVFDVVEQLSNSIKKPVTVKMRSGFKKQEAAQLAKVIEKAGASAITIHARTQEQGYSGRADWKLIKELKETCSIPIIGNGDVVDGPSAEKMLKETNCDYVMIGRAARNNPWIFKQILHYLETKKVLKQSVEEKINLFKEYRAFGEDNLKLLRMRAIDFSKGIPHTNKLRVSLSKARTIEAIELALEELRLNNQCSETQ